MKRIFKYAGIVFFAALFLSRLHYPSTLYFDEIHYVPAAKKLILLEANLNWEHPPLAKWLWGGAWLLFTQLLGLLPEPQVFRLVNALFGVATLWGVRTWMTGLGFSEEKSQVALWLTGFNFLWLTLSKTVLIETIYIGFGIWGLYFVWQNSRQPLLPKKPWARYLGWVLLGLSAASKWSAAPFFLLTLFFFRKRPFALLKGLACAGFVYFLTFLPLMFLKEGNLVLSDWWGYQTRMFEGMRGVHDADHPYRSSPWQWPLMLRPIWFAFEQLNEGVRMVWAGGNPLLFWASFPSLFVIAKKAYDYRKGPKIKGKAGVGPAWQLQQAAVPLALLYWTQYLFWVFISGSLKYFYYYAAPSLWLGPILVWSFDYFKFKRRSLYGFCALCGALFLYYLPILDGRLLPPGRHLLYMWLRWWL